MTFDRNVLSRPFSVLGEVVFAEWETLRQSGLLFSAGLVSGVFVFGMNLILSRFFGPVGFGAFKTVASLVATVWMLVEWGMHTTIIKKVPELLAQGRRPEAFRLIQKFYLLRLSLAGVIALGLALFRHEIAATFLHDPSASPLVLAGIAMVVAGYLELSRSAITGLQRFKVLSVTIVLIPALGAVFSVGLVRHFGVTGALFGLAASYAIGAIPNLVVLFREGVFRRTGATVSLRETFRTYSVPVFASSLPALIVPATIPLLSTRYHPLVIGHYAFAYTFASAVTFVAGAIAQVFLPKISALGGSGDFRAARTKLRNTFVLYGLIAIAGIGLTFLLARPVVSLAAPVYLPSLPIFVGLVSLAVLTGFLTIATTYLTALARLREATVLTFLSGLLWLTGSLLLLEQFGPRLVS